MDDDTRKGLTYAEVVLKVNRFQHDYESSLEAVRIFLKPDLEKGERPRTGFLGVEVPGLSHVRAFTQGSGGPTVNPSKSTLTTKYLRTVQKFAGILQGAFFSYDRPNYLNYGGIGFVTGHEITHGFDDRGRQFDKEGNLVDWWQPETAERHLKKAACVVRQYGNYAAEQVGMKLNGVSTQGENIADNGGAKLAYRAYNAWARRHGSEKRLPGLEKYAAQQMFWISAANIFCAKERPEFLQMRITTDPHSPEVFRICGTFSNRVEFANDFGCPAGSKMNPSDKCEVW